MCRITAHRSDFVSPQNTRSECRRSSFRTATRTRKVCAISGSPSGPIGAIAAQANAAALTQFLELDATKWQYTHGVRRLEAISPDNWLIDQHLLDRPGNRDIQLQLFYDYRSNLPRYPEWQAYFRRHQPPTLIVWGKNDQIFPADGAHPYKRDLKDLEFHLLDTGHFALEEDHHVIAGLMRRFLETRVKVTMARKER